MCIEVVIKLLVNGDRYFKDHWNTLDLIIIVASLAALLVKETMNLRFIGTIIVIRTIRLARIPRYCKEA